MAGHVQQGTMTQTGNPFDLAVRSGGYFTVATNRGPRLTRDGRFGPLPNGTIGNGNGDALLDTNGKPLQIGPTDTQITITADGAISSENGQLGTIGVVTPADPNKLQAEGGHVMAIGHAHQLSPRNLVSCKVSWKGPT